jgi:hypothetical protein
MKVKKIPSFWSVANTEVLYRFNIAFFPVLHILQFGEESKHLMCLNSFIIECHEMMKTFFRECCNVEELEEHFCMHEFTEATMISRPVLYISLQVC